MYSSAISPWTINPVMSLLTGEVFEQNEQLVIIMGGKLHSITENTLAIWAPLSLKVFLIPFKTLVRLVTEKVVDQFLDR